MKSNRHTIALIAAFALPFTLIAQTSTGSGAGSSSGSGSSSSLSSSGQRDSSNTSNAGSSRNSGSNAGLGSNGTNSMSGETALHRVTKESLDAHLTAKDLIDKDVYDRDNKKIGKVVDVVLPASQAGSLAYAFSDSKNYSNSGSSTSGSSSGMTGNSSARSGANSGMTGTGSAIGGTSSDNTNMNSSTNSNSRVTMPNTSSSGSLSDMQSGNSSQASVVISHGGMMNKQLIQLPLSQLRYDSTEKRLIISESEVEINGLASIE